MTLSRDEKAELARYRFRRAEGLLRDDETLLASGSSASSANRSYYAALTAARALLLTRGTDPELHEGVKVLLSREFIRTGLLPRDVAEIFRVLQARRMDSDYGDFIEFGSTEAENSLEQAKRFIGLCGQVLETILGGAG